MKLWKDIRIIVNIKRSVRIVLPNMGNKRKKGTSSSANYEEAMATDDKGSIDSLKKAMEDGFSSLREEVTKLREDFKNEIKPKR